MTARKKGNDSQSRIGGLFDHEREPTGIEEIELSTEEANTLDAAESRRGSTVEPG